MRSGKQRATAEARAQARDEAQRTRDEAMRARSLIVGERRRPTGQCAGERERRDENRRRSGPRARTTS